MIDEATLKAKIEAHIEGSENFLVDLSIGGDNRIIVELDNDVAVSIEECMKLSRYIEDEVLDRETEDFQLEVSSPGVTRPFKVNRQYKKNIGREVKVTNIDGTSLKGILTGANETGIEVTTKAKQLVEGHKKKKEWVETIHPLAFENIKETKIVLAF